MIDGKTVSLAAARFAVVAVCLMAAACQTGPVDKGGRGVRLSEWRAIEVADVDLNLPLLIPVKVTAAEYQNRDNQINHHRMELDGGKGIIVTEHFPTAWYSEATEKRMGDLDVFKVALARRFERTFAEVGEIREVVHGSRKAIGYSADVDITDPGRGKCFFAVAAYRLKPSTGYGNDPGNVDTVVTISYCDVDGQVPDFSRALENVAVVTNHDAFAEALVEK
ncbi:MAG: hypothetical protein IH626_15095 [Rhodospirillales bacterium]|nr:hypothetical protein [Rhodospirillales bacterium]